MQSVDFNDIDFETSNSQSLSKPIPQTSTQRVVVEEGIKSGLTETDAKQATFGVRMYLADKQLSELEDEFLRSGGNSGFNPANIYDRMMRDSFALLDQTPLGNFLMTNEGQLYQVALENFNQAVLRDETGAQIADSEQVMIARRYTPKVGDDFDTIKRKIEARKEIMASKKAMVSNKLWEKQMQKQKEEFSGSSNYDGDVTELDVIQRIRKSPAFRQKFKERFPADYARMEQMGLI